MAEQAPEPKESRRTLTIRSIAPADFARLERMGRRLGMPMETFGRTILHLVALDGPNIFQRALHDALATSQAPADTVEGDEG